MHQCPNCKALSISSSRMLLAWLPGKFECPNCHATLQQKASLKNVIVMLPFVGAGLMQHFFPNKGWVNEVLWVSMAGVCAFAICSKVVVLTVTDKGERA